MNIIRFVKNWMLPIAMAIGVASYYVYVNIPALDGTHAVVNRAIGYVQPALLFCMLFVSFCRMSIRELKPRAWMLELLAIQVVSFVMMGLLIVWMPNVAGRVVIESAMICMICPTATAAAVITGKLGGDMPGIITYTILINIVTALIVPAIVPLVHPAAGISFTTAFCMIMAKTFPLLIMPCVCAWLVRFLLPSFHRWILHFNDLALYLWSISLPLAIVVTTRSIVKSGIPVSYMAGMAAVSLLCCTLQFWAGRRIGAKYGSSVTAGQALGQKNTVFAIWMAYTFMTPVTSIAGGFYSLWHNLFNSWQLYRQGHPHHHSD